MNSNSSDGVVAIAFKPKSNNTKNDSQNSTHHSNDDDKMTTNTEMNVTEESVASFTGEIKSCFTKTENSNKKPTVQTDQPSRVCSCIALNSMSNTRAQGTSESKINGQDSKMSILNVGSSNETSQNNRTRVASDTVTAQALQMKATDNGDGEFGSYTDDDKTGQACGDEVGATGGETAGDKGGDGERANRNYPKVRSWVKRGWIGAFVLAYFVYFTLAMVWSFQRALPVLCLTLLGVWIFMWRHVSRTDVIVRLRHSIVTSVQAFSSKWLRRKRVRLTCYGVSMCVMLTYCVVINVNTPENLLSLGGVAVLLLFCWIISYDRANISLRPVVWGLGAQLVLGVLVLKTRAGTLTFQWLGHQVELFLAYVTAGVTFVFGEKYEDFYFAFRLMPTVLFVSSVMSLLYYVGVMPAIVNVISKVMNVTMGTTAPETVSTAASIFLGQPEASFTITPYLETMTNSELHAIMTAGFASVSADIFGLFVDYGVSSAHILTAVLMSAPAGLAVSKIVCPMPVSHSTVTAPPVSSHSAQQDGPQNIIDAAARGAQDAVNIVLAVGATLIAFLSILAFINNVVTYLGSLVHIPDLTLELALSYVLMPLSYLMGVPWEDCRVVGEVVGLKTILNEFVGYERLGKYIHQNALSKRSQVIATYALCGFSNPTTVGVTLGGLSALVPSRRRDLAKHVISAWICGCVACFLTASFAGLLYEEDSLMSNSTLPTNVTVN